MASCEMYISLNLNCIMQDFRGRYNSQGSFDFWTNTSTDSYVKKQNKHEWIEIFSF